MSRFIRLGKTSGLWSCPCTTNKLLTCDLKAHRSMEQHKEWLSKISEIPIQIGPYNPDKIDGIDIRPAKEK